MRTPPTRDRRTRREARQRTALDGVERGVMACTACPVGHDVAPGHASHQWKVASSPSRLPAGTQNTQKKTQQHEVTHTDTHDEI